MKNIKVIHVELDEDIHRALKHLMLDNGGSWKNFFQKISKGDR
jgi:hypothetical protein